jgi:4-diphosphocytidyl-2-C-methyl-D-erythritol kinase
VSASGVRVRVPGKVNLHLSVGDVRPDDYHELVTVFQAVDIHDEVVAEPADELRVTVSGRDAPDVPTDERNLAWRAAQVLADTAGMPPRVHLHIAKDIPLAGGMAGGSADAAAALVACSRLWDLDAGPGDLAALAAKLGSDVTFPILGRTAVGTGRGEVLEPVDCPVPLNWVFAMAGFGISAADAYRALDRQRGAGSAPPPVGPPERLVAALADGDIDRIAACLGNDLEPAALSLAPQLRRTLDRGHQVDGVLASLVSGSGPTCAFLCADAETATVLAATLETERVCRAARVAIGPAPGAAVVA